MQVEFVGGPKNNIESKIKDLLKSSDKISIAVAFLENSGVATIRQSLEETKKNKESISIITGLDFGITSPEALQELHNLKVSCNIFKNARFHPKLYIFEKNNNEVTVIIGSSNFSKGGLSTNYEANVILTGNISEVPIKEAFEYYSYLYSKSVPLDDKLIELYSKRKNLADEMNTQVDKDERLNKLTDELKEYLNQKVPFLEVELTESEREKLSQAEKKFDEGWNLYETGLLNHASDLFKESYDVYSKLIDLHVHNNIILNEITNCLLGMGWTNYSSHKFEEAKRCTDDAEKFANLLENKEFLLGALGLGALARDITKEANEKCDEFIEIYEANKSISDYKEYNLIGLIYLRSAECKFESNIKINVAYKQVLQAIKYLEKIDLSKDNFDSMNNRCNIASAYIVKNNIKPEPDFNKEIVIGHYEAALRIARNELKSEFWEADAMLDLANAVNIKGTPYITDSETCNYLRNARKIFNKLEYIEIIKEIDELRKNIGCRS
ncbi:MAG: NgoFVII family restriction endonuclease [Spirochaetes bacterium]|nr:NgoFVII family restriction endonuclease [Spirochaetota bacterium]